MDENNIKLKTPQKCHKDNTDNKKPLIIFILYNVMLRILFTLFHQYFTFKKLKLIIFFIQHGGPILISTTILSQWSRFQLKFNLISIKIDQNRSIWNIFWLKDWNRPSKCRLFNPKWSNLIEIVKFTQKSSCFWPFSIKYDIFLIEFELNRCHE